MRITTGLVVAGSLILTAATVTNAFLINKQFYPSIVYLTKSSPSMAVIYFQGLIILYLLFQLIRKIFFGDLRASESEHLSERTWHAVMETCLAFTVFRDDFSPFFVMQFVGLLFVKSFHWLSDDRVDMMERSPVITLKFHLRMMSLVAFLGAVDSYMVSHAYFTTLIKGASAQIVFGFEYAILMTMIVHVTIKYVLHMHDLRSASQWENKPVYLLYAELFINLLRVLLLTAFMLVMVRVRTFPLFSVRPFYLALRSFHKALNDVLLSRRAINAMNNLFPVVTSEELASMDTTCIICREEMTGQSGAKRLPCGHVFHANCLRSWFQRQQTCPTCRTDILGRPAPTRPAPAAQNANGQNNQQQQPQQGNQLPQIPANMFPFMAHQFAFPPPMQPNQAANGQQQPPQTGAPQGQNQNATPPAGAPPGFMPPPFFPPPFPMPGMFPMPPMPFAPPPAPFAFPTRPDFSGLTDEELLQMEGNARTAVEARIQVLADISTLLDAAVLQMQQYSSIVSAQTPIIPQQAPTTPTATPATPTAAPATPAASGSTADESVPSPTPTQASPSTDNVSPASSASPKSLFGVGFKSPSATSIVGSPEKSTTEEDRPSSSTASPPVASFGQSTPISPSVDQSSSNQTDGGEKNAADNDSLNEIRQRRLQRFAEAEAQSQ